MLIDDHRAWYQERGDLEKAKFGTANFGTTKVCQIIPRYSKVRSHFSGVIVRALVCACPLCPRSLLYRYNDYNHPEPPVITATNQRAIENNNHHSQSMLLVPQSGNFVPKCKEVFKIGATISPHQNSPFQISHASNFPSPGSPIPRAGRHSGAALWGTTGRQAHLGGCMQL